MPYRAIAFAPDVVRAYDAFVASIEAAFDVPVEERAKACRDLLASIYFPGGPGFDSMVRDTRLPPATRALVLQLDPGNVTLEHERYVDIDTERYLTVKPMIWFWIMFDRSPMGRNVDLGFRVRQALAERVFLSCGKRLKIFHDVEFRWGYNLEVGDDTTLHRGVMLDDRGGLRLGKSVSVSDWANVYTHTHDVEDIDRITCLRTEIGDGVRLTYHATVLAGCSVGANALVAACALATKPVPANWVWGGVPARPLKEKHGRLDEHGRPVHDGCC